MSKLRQMLGFFPRLIPKSFYRSGTRDWQFDRKLDLTDTIKDGARLFIVDEGIRKQLLLALTEDSKLHIEEVWFQYN